MPVESPDLNTYLCVQMGSLAIIAEELGMVSEGAMWRRRAEAIVHRMVQDLWDEEAGLFRAMLNNNPIQVETPFNLYPVWTGQLPDRHRNRILEHIKNPDAFYGKIMLPTVARNDPHFDPGTMWRGPVWANINYIFIEALEQVGEFELANTLRVNTIDLLLEHSGLYEFYNADTGEPSPAAAGAFGWTAAVFIDLAIQASQKRD
jgi:glycogen debranching enzyme